MRKKITTNLERIYRGYKIFGQGYKKSLKVFLRFAVCLNKKYKDSFKPEIWADYSTIYGLTSTDRSVSEIESEPYFRIGRHNIKTTFDELILKRGKGNLEEDLNQILDNLDNPGKYDFSFGFPIRMGIRVKDKFSVVFDEYRISGTAISILGLGETSEEAAKNHEELKAEYNKFKVKMEEK